MKNLLVFIFSIAFLGTGLFGLAEAPRQDKSVFIQIRDLYQDQLLKRAGKKKDEGNAPEMKMVFEGIDIPHSPDEFHQAFHFPPRCQDLTGSCWSFSSISFFESEIHRLSGRAIKLSEMYTVYYEFVDKAKRFIREKGNSAFTRGSEPNAAIRVCKKYGVVPEEAYPGKMEGQDYYDDTRMFSEMKKYLNSIKKKNRWNEEKAISKIKFILNKYMGKPPSTVLANGKRITPQEYLKNVARIDPDDYIDLLSQLEQPYYQKVEYKVTDNWWHSKDYYNVPLNNFMAIIKNAIRKGYSVCMVGDNLEPGFYPPLKVAMIPTFDIQSELINDNARQLRVSNGTTIDHHAIHLVGYLEKEDGDWYLIKDSMTWAFGQEHPGYMFYHEDFVKLKMNNILIHRDIVPDLTEK